MKCKLLLMTKETSRMKCKLLLMGLLAVSGLTAAEFHLVKNAKPTAQFQLAKDTNEKSHELIDLFNSYLKKVTGTELPKTNKNLSYTIQIVLEKNPKLGTHHNWKIDFPSEKVMKVTATDTSLFQALNAVLEKGADTRFLGIETCMFQYEPKKDVFVQTEPMKSKEGYSLHRETYLLPNHVVELGFYDNVKFLYSHGIPVYAFPAEKYSKGWPTFIMPVQRGKKLVKPSSFYSRWQPCFSNPETAKEAVKNILEILKKQPLQSITLGVNDIGGFCECENCVKMDKGLRKGIFVNDKRNHANSYYTFVNRVAEEVCKEYPELRIGLLAYTGTIMAPDFPVHKNVVPVMTLDSVLGALDPKVKERHWGVINEWGKKVKETGIWDYCWGRRYQIPRVNFKNHADLLKYLYANGGRSYFGENSGIADALDGPKTYLVANLLKDINADPEKLLEEWYNRYAGKAAAPYLKKLYQKCEKYWLTPEMKKTPIFRARNYIYMSPNESHMFALKPGFTKELLDLALTVEKLAKTPGEKARAALLVRHMENLDCIASFQGMAYRAPDNGEFKSVKDVLAYFDFLKKNLPRLMAQHKRARAYFSYADFADERAKYFYLTRRTLYETDAAVILTSGLLKTLCFMERKEIQKGLKELAALPDMPKDIKETIALISQGDKVKNYFSNPKLEKPVNSMKIKTSIPYEITSEVLYNGEKTLKLLPAHPQGVPNPDDNMLSHVVSFSITEKLDPGTWAVSLKVLTKSKRAVMDLCLWRCTNGKNNHWEDLRQIRVQPDKWQTFTQVETVEPRNTGANIILRPSSFKANEPLYIADIRLIRVSNSEVSRDQKIPSVKFASRDKSSYEKLFGKTALVNRNPKGYNFGRCGFYWYRKPGDVMEVTLNAARPAGSKSGKIGVIIYERRDGGWKTGPSFIWNHPVSDKGFAPIKFRVKADQLKGDRFVIGLFKMRGTEAVAVSDITLKFQ